MLSLSSWYQVTITAHFASKCVRKGQFSVRSPFLLELSFLREAPLQRFPLILTFQFCYLDARSKV